MSDGLSTRYSISLGVIVGIAVGCVLFVIVLAFGLYYYYRNRAARHYSDLHFGFKNSNLGEPLLDRGGADGKGNAVEMVSTLWRRATRSNANINDPWQLQYNKLKFGARIGSGAFGTVFDGTYGETKLKVAIKRILLSADADAYRNEIKAAHSEMKILWELRHPVQYFCGLSCDTTLLIPPRPPPHAIYPTLEHPYLLWHRFRARAG
jgi:hypothetical protein